MNVSEAKDESDFLAFCIDFATGITFRCVWSAILELLRS